MTSDPVLRRLAGLGGLWLLVYAALTAVTRGSPAQARFVENVLFILAVMVATALSVVAAVRTVGTQRRMWRLLALSNTMWLLGDLIWLGYEYLGPMRPPLPSLADVPYLLSYVFAVPALMIGLGAASSLRRTRGLLDAALVAFCLGALGWHLVISPLMPDELRVATLSVLAYPLLAVVIVSSLVAMWLSGGRRVAPPVLLAGAGYAASAISDAGYAYLLVRDPAAELGWLNLGWQVQAVLLSLAAAVAVRRPAGQDETRPADRDMAVLPLLAGSWAVAGLVVYDWLQFGGLSRLTLLVTVVLFGGLLTRQLLVTRDRTVLAADLRAALREQERLAVTDGLTGLYNRRFFQEMLHREADLATREGGPLSLLLVDLDQFKKINDSYGHLVGDAVLAKAAERVRRVVRATDMVARYGGEEFVCLLPGSDEGAARAMGERIRDSLSATALSVAGHPGVVLTTSVGVATVCVRPDSTSIDAEGLINEADQALYRAKAYGRDRVVAAGERFGPETAVSVDVPPALAWLADQVDAKLGDMEHATAVSRWSLLVGDRLGLDQAGLRQAAAAGRLHDIGKILVPEAVLTKPDQPTPEEWRQLRRHPQEGGRLVNELAHRPDLARIVATHHERYDGGGYPFGLAGTEIPVEARIIAVCDCWAAMLTNRPYAPARTRQQARARLVAARGSRFDPDVVDTFLVLVDEGSVGDLFPLRPAAPFWDADRTPAAVPLASPT